MPRQAQARQRQLQPPANFQINQTQRNRNAGTPIQDLVEKRVVGVVVIFAVAVKLQLCKQVVAERPNLRLGCAGRLDRRPERLGHIVQQR